MYVGSSIHSFSSYNIILGWNHESEYQPTATEDTKAVLKDTQESCSTAIEILNEMLLYDKIVEGLMTLEKEDLTPQAFIAKTMNPFRSQVCTGLPLTLHRSIYMSRRFYCYQAREGGVTMRFSAVLTAEQRELRFHADPFKVAQVVRNLISNALKFTPRNGWLSIDCI